MQSWMQDIVDFEKKNDSLKLLLTITNNNLNLHTRTSLVHVSA